MIKFKNINGDVFLAVGSVKRKSALNGEKSLSATITQGDDVLNKIDKGWSLEFDNEPYVVTYFERNDNDNTVEIDAIHKFFWDMTKSVLYATYSSSHVARFYLDEIFKDTGYTYALNFDPKAFEKENWGMKNKLSLFNDIISSIGAEFEINGTLISIFKNVGSDLSTIVRHGFNLSDMTLENDNANFATYAEGFGAYEDQENQKGPRLHVTYKSSLAKAFGKLHAEPVDDQRYTVKDNLLQAVKDKVDGSFAVSVKLSLYDLTAAGYPYKMANVGDWLLAVDENLDFKQKIRIISVDDEFAEDGTRISYTVTCGDVGVAKKYQDANASLSQKVQSAYDNAQAAKESAIQAVISSTGKNTNYWFDSVDEMNAFQGNEGDLAFVQIGDGQAMYVYTKMPDGSFKWVKRLDPDTGEQIATGVEEAISTANKYTDELNEKQASEAATFQSEANVALSSAAAERAAFSSNAASMANSASAHAETVASSASAYAKEQAASALNSANENLATAKYDLTTAIGQETEDRNKAVSAVNSQAQTYANQAKADAMSAASSADGVIRTAISSSADSLSATITQNKSSADSGISTAQTTANAAVDGLAFKVSQTDYDQKTGDLSTKVNTVTQTATETKNELANVSKTVDSQSAQINTISNTVDGTTQTISDIQTEQGKQSGSIATLQSRADGFDATVAKVDNLSVGGRNYVQNSSGLNGSSTVRPTLIGTSSGANATVTYPSDGILMTNGATNTTKEWYYQVANAWTNFSDTPLTQGKQITFSADVMGTVPQAVLRYGFNGGTGGKESFKSFDINNNSWTRISMTVTPTPTNTGLYFLIQGGINNRYDNGFSGGETLKFRYVKIEDGNTPTAWSPAPEDLSGATAKAQLTADNAALNLSKYQTDANGRISKAQADITATSKEVSTKVSQSDFDTKTGDLTTKYGQVKATADSVTTDVTNYKKSNDGRIKADEANIDANSKAIALKVSQVDYDANNNTINGKFAQQTIESGKILDSVTELQASVNSLGQVNQLMNTEFNPDLEGWITDSVGRAPYRSYFDTTVNKVTVGFNTQNNDIAVSMLSQKVALASTPGARGTISLSWQARSTDGSTGTQTVSMSFVDSSGNTIGKSITADWTDRGTGWNIKKIEGINIPDKATSVTVAFIVSEKVTAYLAKPMLVFDATIGDYVAGNYNNNARVAAVEVSLDGITGLVNDPKNGLSATATLAANGLSVATKAQSDATIAITTAQGIQTQVNSNDGDIKNLQSTLTQTANQIATEVVDRKSGDSAVTTQLTNLIDSRVTSVTSGYESAISQSADTIMASVSMPNKLVNTEFEPDLEGWTIGNPLSGTGNPAKINVSNGYKSSNGLRINAYTDNTDDVDAYYNIQQIVKVPSNVSVASLHIMGFIYAISSNGYAYVNANVAALDSTGKTISVIVPGTELFNKNKTQTWQESSSTFINMSIPAGTDSLKISIYARGQTRVNISQPMLVFANTFSIYQAGSYNNMGTSTVLSLLKDNWAIGIQDNSGKLISGINGDTSNTRIVGKQITLDGDVTVTADFYAKGGNFKNLNASNITTGTINAAKINVINLDVSSLSGNITNFIKSYWSDAYSNQVAINANNVSFYTNSHRSSTVISEGQIDMTVYNGTTKTSEHIGGLKHGTVQGRDNQDYLIMYLDGWKTRGGHPDNAAEHGGDGFMFSVSDGWNMPTGIPLLTWENELLAGNSKHLSGWHFYDHTEFHTDVMMFPDGAYQGLWFGSTNFNGTTYPGIFGNQQQDNGPGILFGSTELYFLYKNTAYPLSVVLKAAAFNI